ncbi:hypothetical protein PHISCL_03884 [Aspergillus sclerotialis]|uniref:Uncharacterized protein n=1 Tax=Aspergillus sclerotialis TaxID=2070753 RepID=A0A3A2ZKR3_9EURO|nr:hypothetical protein PHISCL_03884 [Aspergillus sclerotialis]
MSPHPPLNPESYEMNTALQEAITCTTCTYTPPNFQSLRAALSTGKYSFRRDPPFTTSPLGLGDRDTSGSISPRERRDDREAGYGRLMSAPQRARYRELVLGAISRVAYSLSPASGSEPRSRTRDTTRFSHSTGYAPGNDPVAEMTTMLGFYQVDYHVHLHYATGRGILSFCRDVADVHALRRWRSELEVASPSPGHGNENEASGRRTRQKSGLWSDGPEFMDQVSLWRRRWRERKARVEAARLRWVGIMEERRVQRSRVGGEITEGIN